MENMWRDEGRRGQPQNSSTRRGKGQPPTGFEGMNFEQKRRPYREDDKQAKGQDEEVNRGGKRD